MEKPIKHSKRKLDPWQKKKKKIKHITAHGLNGQVLKNGNVQVRKEVPSVQIPEPSKRETKELERIAKEPSQEINVIV